MRGHGIIRACVKRNLHLRHDSCRKLSDVGYFNFLLANKSNEVEDQLPVGGLFGKTTFSLLDRFSNK